MKTICITLDDTDKVYEAISIIDNALDRYEFSHKTYFTDDKEVGK